MYPCMYLMSLRRCYAFPMVVFYSVSSEAKFLTVQSFVEERKGRDKI